MKVATLGSPAIALIGLGGYAQVHLRFLRQCADERLGHIASAVAIPGTDPADIARLPPNVRLYPSFEAWRDGESGRCDLCFLPTPIHLHAGMTLDALRDGGSVLVEKPLAACWQDVEGILRARPAAGRFVAVGFQDLYLPQAHQLQAALLDGRHGRLRQIRVLGQWPRADPYYRRNHWAGRLAVPEGRVLDSPLNNALGHFLMLALFLAGETPGDAAVVVRGEAELYRSRAIESFDTAFVRLQARSGTEIFCAMSHSGIEEGSPRLDIETDGTHLEWHAWKELRSRQIGRDVGAADVRPLSGMDATRSDMFRRLCLRARGETGFVCSPGLAAAHSAVILDLHDSCPIHPVPVSLLRVTALDGQPSVEIAGIDELLRTCFAAARLPSELEVPWAAPASRFTCVHSARLASFNTFP